MSFEPGLPVCSDPSHSLGLSKRPSENCPSLSTPTACPPQQSEALDLSCLPSTWVQCCTRYPPWANGPLCSPAAAAVQKPGLGFGPNSPVPCPALFPSVAWRPVVSPTGPHCFLQRHLPERAVERPASLPPSKWPRPLASLLPNGLKKLAMFTHENCRPGPKCLMGALLDG